MMQEASLSNWIFCRLEGQKKAAVMMASGPRFELKTFRIRSRSADQALDRGVGFYVSFV